jgi:hypothetical protein
MLIAMCSFAAAASAQTTVTLSTPGTHINADLTIQGGASGMTDFSTSDGLASKVSSESFTRRVLLKIDTQNYIPANTVIQSARLYLVLKSAESSENRPFTAFNVAQSFVKGETNWYYFRSGQPWAKPGGDFNGSLAPRLWAMPSADLFDVEPGPACGHRRRSRYTRVALVDTGANTNGTSGVPLHPREQSAFRPRPRHHGTTAHRHRHRRRHRRHRPGTTLRLMQ